MVPFLGPASKNVIERCVLARLSRACRQPADHSTTRSFRTSNAANNRSWRTLVGARVLCVTHPTAIVRSPSQAIRQVGRPRIHYGKAVARPGDRFAKLFPRCRRFIVNHLEVIDRRLLLSVNSVSSAAAALLEVGDQKQQSHSLTQKHSLWKLERTGTRHSATLFWTPDEFTCRRRSA